MRKENKEIKAKAARKGRLIRAAQTVIMAVVFILSMTVPSLATEAGENPLTILLNFENFIFSVIRVVGIIASGYAIVQIGTSFSTHDPSQRSMGILTLVGGIIVAFSKEILTLIGMG